MTAGATGPRSGTGRRLLLATRNRKKLAELERILPEVAPGLTDVEILGLDDVPAYDEPVESAADFAGNALLKARTAFERTGLPSIADDSGLCVDALNQMPGVLSARWSGRPTDDGRNVALVLDQIADVPEERRGAAFVANVALVYHRTGDADPHEPGGSTESDGPTEYAEYAEQVVEGRVSGRIGREPRGENGFGYDPIFIPTEQDGPGTSGVPGERERTLAELTSEEKDAISHRGRALRKLATHLPAALR